MQCVWFGRQKWTYWGRGHTWAAFVVSVGKYNQGGIWLSKGSSRRSPSAIYPAHDLEMAVYKTLPNLEDNM